MSPAVSEEIKAVLSFVMLCTDEWKHRNLLTNYYTCCLALFPPPSASQTEVSCLIYSHLNSQFKESLSDGQLVPKSIGNSYKKRPVSCAVASCQSDTANTAFKNACQHAHPGTAGCRVEDHGLMRIHKVS